MVNMSSVTLEDGCLEIGDCVHGEGVLLFKYHIFVATCDDYCDFEIELSSKDRALIKKWASEL